MPGVDARLRRERAVAELASAQHGAVTRRQLLELGLGPGAIDKRLRSRQLHTIHRGVYLLGHRAQHPRAAEMAAVLACGPDAVISHRSAAFLWRLTRTRDRPWPIELSVQAGCPSSRSGLRVHRLAALPSLEVGKLDGVPVTLAARTILDLAAVAGSQEVEQALAEAEVRGLVTKARMRTLVEHHRGRAGTGLLKRLLDDGPSLTRSKAEARMLGLIRRAKLPTPLTLARVGRHEVDFLWPAQRLVVEVDGFRFHSGARAFERDRLRDAELAARGYVVIRVTWRQIVDEPEAVVARVAQALAARMAA